MRLLKVDSMKLEFFASEKPAFATLSHTWNASEVTYTGLHSLSLPHHPGFSKIVQTCAQARLDRCPYVWIDTCCIDKRDNSELNEAINSMFEWYESARYCYAFLQDVDDVSDIEEFRWLPETVELTETQVWKIRQSQFARSRYWTRGWTLPELIAPRFVIFFDSKFQRIGCKEELSRVVSLVSGVDEAMLRHHTELEDYSIATRMSWAANRETTKAEDMAYCLLGIFRIRMPLLYGEGEYAFVRFQEEIIKVSNDHSIFAWSETSFSTDDNRLLLALRPSAFRNSDCIVPLRHWEHPSEHRMTHAGLKIRLPIFPASLRPDIKEHSDTTRGENCWFAPLGCRYEMDLSGYIGIELEETTENNVYAIHRRRDRLFVVDITPEEASRYMKSILIRSALPWETTRAEKRGRYNKKCVIRWRGDERLQYGESWPCKAWNKKKDLLWVKHDKEILGGLRLYTNRCATNEIPDVLLRIGYRRVNSSHATTWEDAWVSLKPIEFTSVEEICESDKLNGFAAHREMSQRLELPGSGKWLHATIGSQEVMQEDVFVVELCIVEGTVGTPLEENTESRDDLDQMTGNSGAEEAVDTPVKEKEKVSDDLVHVIEKSQAEDSLQSRVSIARLEPSLPSPSTGRPAAIRRNE